MQVAQRGQRLQPVRDRLLDRQRVAPAVREAALVGDVLQGLAADVLHHDVAVGGAGPQVRVLDEVDDADDVRVVHLGQEAAFGDGHRQGVLVPGVEQALEHHPLVVDPPVDRQVDPAEPAVRQAADHLVLPADQVAAAQLGRERVRGAALGAEAVRAAGPAVPVPAHRGVALGAEPLALRHLRVLQDRQRRIGGRDGRHRHQAGAQPVPAGGAAASAAAHRDRAAAAGAGGAVRAGPAGQRTGRTAADRGAADRGAVGRAGVLAAGQGAEAAPRPHSSQ